MPTLESYDGKRIDSLRPEHAHARSSSQGPVRMNQDSAPVFKNKSSHALADMTASRHAPGFQRSRPSNDSDQSLNTLPDPQNTSSSDLPRARSPSPRPAGLSEEVENLSNKLILAINHQTSLEDTLSQVRHELETSQDAIQRLQAAAVIEKDKTDDALTTSKEQAEDEKARLAMDLENERKQKGAALEDKRGMEQELETLTASLFEEANNMVATANKERDAVERRNQILRDQVKDTESLLASQQEQLAQLKLVMQEMGTEHNRDDRAASVRNSTGPSSPSSFEERDTTVLRLLEAMNLSPRSIDSGGNISPAPSTSLTHLLKPVCRTDLPAYEDFRVLVQSSQKSTPASRVTSGSYAGLSVMGLGSLTSSTSTVHRTAPNSSTTSLNTPNSTNQSATPSPQIPGSFSSQPNANTIEKGPIPLKDMKFYKRLLVEDIEPTLRFDLSPTINWLNRRSLLSALAENGLIVEPIPERSLRLYGRYTPCALCGEARKDNSNARTHRMRSSEGESANKWLLCILCLEKVRATCDLVGYVRMVRDGVVRCADHDEEAEAWEELVRLRERLFWARMAGGVVPSFIERVGAEKGTAERKSIDGLKDEEREFVDAPSERASTDSQTTDNDTEAAAASQLQRNLSDSLPPPLPSSSPNFHSKFNSNANPHSHSRSESAPTDNNNNNNNNNNSMSMPPIRDITPATPPRFPIRETREKRGGSWGNLKVSVPKAWAQLTSDDVNVLR